MTARHERHTLQLMGICDPHVLFSAAIEHRPDPAHEATMLELIRHLNARRARGLLDSLTESNVEQSFNERLFAEVFGYRTLLQHGAEEFHLLPKAYLPATKRYPDFLLGWFGPLFDLADARVAVELKGPGADLDAPQPSYGGISAVQQALEAISGLPQVRWVIVSNFDELRLYAATDDRQFEAVLLSDVTTSADLRRLYALFSKRTLLGTRERSGAVGDILAGKGPSVLPPKTDHLRLTHIASVKSPGEPRFLSELEDAFLHGIDKMRMGWAPASKGASMAAVGERLTIRDKAGLAIVEIAPAGTLIVHEYLEEMFHPEELAAKMCCFRGLAFCVLQEYQQDVQLSCRLSDFSDRTVCHGTIGWTNSGAGGVSLKPQPSTRERQTPLRTYPRAAQGPQSADFISERLAHEVRELLYGFSASMLGATIRLTVDKTTMKSFLDKERFFTDETFAAFRRR